MIINMDLYMDTDAYRGMARNTGEDRDTDTDTERDRDRDTDKDTDTDMGRDT
jgi:hypothetical protein